MMENSVVLPAPFGPTSATIWPSSAISDARSSASSPPKRREMFSTRKSSCMTAPQETRNAARRERHHGNQHATVDHEVEPRHVAGDELGGFAERLHHQRAEQRAEYRADAADHGREQRLDRDPGAISDAGVEEEKILRVEAAARRGHRGELDAKHVDAGGSGGVLVLADGYKVCAEAACFEALRNQQRDRDEAEDDPVERRAALELECFGAKVELDERADARAGD